MKQQPRYYVAGRIATSKHFERIGLWGIADREDQERITDYRASKAEAEQTCREWNRRHQQQAKKERIAA